MTLFLLPLVIILATIVESPAIAQLNSELDLESILNDARSRGLLGRSLFYSVVPLSRYSTQAEPPDRVAALTDQPVSNDVLGWPISTTLQNILLFHDVPEFTPTDRARLEHEIYDRVLLRRAPIALRWLGVTLDKSKPSRSIRRYRRFEAKWITAHERTQQAIGRGGSLQEIAYNDKLEAQALARWNEEGARRHIELMFLRKAFNDAKDPLLTWDEIELQYLQAGGALIEATGRPPTGYVASQITSAERSSDGWLLIAGGARSIEYKLVKVDRPWLDERIFGFYRWRWSRSSPFDINTAIGSSSDCAEVSALACMNDYIIVVRDAGSEAAGKSVGFIARSIAYASSRMREHNSEENDEIWRRPVSAVVGRLRDGSF